MNLQVTIKNVYGNDLIYPVCETSQKFTDLLNVKTFNQQQLRKIADLGFEIEVVAAIGVINSERTRVLASF